MSDINQVRQILMNELGLSRATVRGMVEEIVKETVDVKVTRMMADGHIQRMVDDSVRRFAASSRWDSDAVRKIVAKAAGEAVESQINQILAR